MVLKADRMGLVEGVVGEVQNFIIDILGNLLRNTVGNGAGDLSVRVAVDKGLPL